MYLAPLGLRSSPTYKPDDLKHKRLDIQGLRAIAVIMVVAYHAGLPMPGGFVGVDVFFVISGFVITQMLERELSTQGRIRFRRFYIRRFKRLTPALALLVSFTVIGSAILQSFISDQSTTAMTAIGAMFLSANIVIAGRSGGYFDAPAEANPLLHTWSLSVEEQFYLMFPLILALGWCVARRYGTRQPSLRHAALALVCVIALMSLMLTLWGATQPPAANFFATGGFYSPLARAWEFAAGAILALSFKRGLSRFSATFVAIAGLAALAASLWLITANTPFPGTWTLVPVAGTVLLLAAGSSQANPVSRLLATPFMVKIGDWSYSLYLWHWPLIVFSVILWPERPMMQLGAAVLSLAPAALSYAYVEQPIRSSAIGTRLRQAAMVAATIIVPIGLASILAVGAKVKWGLQWEAGQSQQSLHVAFQRGCIDQAFDPDVCRWSPASPTGTVLLVGDSQAYAYADGVIAAANNLGMAAVVSSRSGCPMGRGDTTGAKPLSCTRWQEEVVAYALRTRPDVVVIANRSAGYTHPNSGWRTMVDQNGERATAQTAVRLYGEALSAAVRPLARAGIRVILIQNMAEPVSLSESTSLFRRVFPAETPRTFDADESLQWRAQATALEEHLDRAYVRVALYDPVNYLCPEKLCMIETPTGEPVFMDKTHVTRAGALMLTLSLERILAAQATQENDVS